MLYSRAYVADEEPNQFFLWNEQLKEIPSIRKVPAPAIHEAASAIDLYSYIHPPQIINEQGAYVRRHLVTGKIIEVFEAGDEDNDRLPLIIIRSERDNFGRLETALGLNTKR